MPSSPEQMAFFTGLKGICPKSAVLTSVFIQESVQDTSKSSRSLPVTITSYYNPKYKELSPGQLSEKCERIFKEVHKITCDEAAYL